MEITLHYNTLCPLNQICAAVVPLPRVAPYNYINVGFTVTVP